MNRTEFQLIEEITHVPEDNDRRLVYADWLAERGDLRAEFIRLEVELEQRYRIRSVKEIVRSLLKISRTIANPDWEKSVLHLRASQLIMSLSRRSAK